MTCWCGGEVAPRSPGDAMGLGCLDHIAHNWTGCSYTTSTADYCHAHGGYLADPYGRCESS